MTAKIIYIFMGIGLGLALLQRWQQAPRPTLSEVIEIQVKETVSTLAFSEMTIPALRARNYQSQLGELQQISQNANFTTYLTHYTSDSLRINALLTKPTGETPTGGWPAIVFVHGYIPPSLYRTQEKYVDYVNYLARNGFVVLKIDLRGHGSSEGSPSGSYYSNGYIIDTLNAYAALQASDFVNPAAIGLWGHSMAGNIVLRSLAARPNIPAAVIWAGAGYTYQDLRDYGLNDNSYRPPTPTRSPNVTGEQKTDRQRLFETYGQFDPTVSFWQQVAATNYLNDLQGALQLHHAQDDTVVSIKYSQNLNQLLDQTQVTHEFYSYSSGGHNLTGGSFSQAMQRTTAFYKTYLAAAE